LSSPLQAPSSRSKERSPAHRSGKALSSFHRGFSGRGLTIGDLALADITCHVEPVFFSTLLWFVVRSSATNCCLF
jgi:hypothetical protein